MTKSYIVSLLSALPVLIWISCSSSDSNVKNTKIATQKTEMTKAAAREPRLPAVARYWVQDSEGTRHQLSEWIGKQPVVINFWGTWCGPCRMEIPGLIRLYDEYKGRGVEILSLALRDQPVQVNQFAERAGMNWVMLLANENVVRAFGYPRAVPTTIFLDKKGREVSRHTGARPYEVFKPEFEAIASGS